MMVQFPNILRIPARLLAEQTGESMRRIAKARHRPDPELERIIADKVNPKWIDKQLAKL